MEKRRKAKPAASAAAVEMNRIRWGRTTKAERTEAARKAARARWARRRKIKVLESTIRGLKVAARVAKAEGRKGKHRAA